VFAGKYKHDRDYGTLDTGNFNMDKDKSEFDEYTGTRVEDYLFYVEVTRRDKFSNDDFEYLFSPIGSLHVDDVIK
jgi:hypothetical protein